MEQFEYDPRKSQANRDKHGIDFHEARALWQDAGRIEVRAATTDEPRYLVIEQVAGRFWTAVATRRGAVVRIISVRRSRKSEENLYESHNRQGI